MAATSPSSSRTRHLPHTSVEECSRGHRQPITEYLTEDTGLEDEFFRRRTLSLGDFDGTREIASPTRPRERVKHPAHHDIQPPLMPCSAIHYQTKPKYYEWDYGSTPTNVKLLDENRNGMWFGDEESIRDDHSFMLPEQLEGLIGGVQGQIPPETSLTHNAEPQCTIDADLEIKTAGPLKPHLATSNHITERALVPSIRGEIDNASMPELTQGGSDEDLLSVVDPGFDASSASLHLFSQAGVHITTQDLQDNFVAAQVTSLTGGYLNTDHMSQIEKERTTSGFFSMSRPEGFSSSPEAAIPTGTIRVHKRKQDNTASASQQYLLPAVYDDLADEDCYLGRAAKVPSNPHFDAPQSVPSERTPSTDDNMLPARLRYRVHRPSEAQHNEDFYINVLGQPATASTIRGIPLNRLFVLYGEQPLRQSLTKTKTLTPNLMVAEAPFRDSALMQRRIDKLDSTRKRKADDQENTCNPKRARITLLDRRLNQSKAHASYLSEARSITSIRDASTISSKSSLNSHLLTSPMPQALKGFTGQFELYIPDKLSYLKTSTIHRPFGCPTHPNGMITNTRFTPDNRHANNDLTEYDINHDAALLAVTQNGEQHSIKASSLHTIRTPEENDLRKEAHRECTSARLEGVPVGYYRYFLGHMTVEEYVEAGLCVCWDKCFCNKFCTRFGDLRCPCAVNLVMVEVGE